MGGSNTDKTEEHDLKAIKYPTYGTHHRLCIIRRNKIQLIQDPSD